MNAKNAAMISWIIGIMLFLLALGTWAFAADAAPVATVAAGAGVSELSAFLQGTVFPIITAFFMGLVAIFLRKLGVKFGIDTLTQQNNILERLTLQGVTLAEEKAAQLLGSRAALTGNQKLDVAVGHILSFMPTISPTQAASLVESMLAQISGVGATKDSAFATGPGYPAAEIVTPLAA